MKKLIIIAIFIATIAGLVYAQTVRWRIQEIDGTVLATVNDSGDLILAGGVTASGATTLSAAVNITAATDISADLTVDGGFILEPPATIVQLDTSTALGTLDSFVLIVGSNAVTGVFVMISDATPFISTTTATEGQLITLMGTNSTGTVQLSDNGTVTGSLLELDGTTIVLGLGSNVTFRYYGGKWWQTGGINTID